jgi:hypothetical protein
MGIYHTWFDMQGFALHTFCFWVEVEYRQNFDVKEASYISVYLIDFDNIVFNLQENIPPKENNQNVKVKSQLFD